jgi:hypothetical protein
VFFVDQSKAACVQVELKSVVQKPSARGRFFFMNVVWFRVKQQQRGLDKVDTVIHTENSEHVNKGRDTHEKQTVK